MRNGRAHTPTYGCTLGAAGAAGRLGDTCCSAVCRDTRARTVHGTVARPRYTARRLTAVSPLAGVHAGV